jgi:hypothetical protein
MGSLSGAELSGERMSVAYDTRDQEDEHSCFSDNTHNDFIANALGIENVYLGRWGDQRRGQPQPIWSRARPGARHHAARAAAGHQRGDGGDPRAVRPGDRRADGSPSARPSPTRSPPSRPRPRRSSRSRPCSTSRSTSSDPPPCACAACCPSRSCSPAPTLRRAVDESRSGGDTTVFDATGNAFALSARNMSFDRRQRFAIGNSFFNKNWVTAPPRRPAATASARPSTPARARPATSRTAAAARPPPARRSRACSCASATPAVYGDQLQPQAIDDVPGEGTPRVTYSERPARSPTASPTRCASRPTRSTTPRSAAAARLHDLSARRPGDDRHGPARRDPRGRHPRRRRPRRRDGDGISGRPNYVLDVASGDDRARPPRLEGQPAERPPAGRRRVPRRHGHHLEPVPRTKLSRGPARVRAPRSPAASPRSRITSWTTSSSTRPPSPCPRAAAWTTPPSRAASRSS